MSHHPKDVQNDMPVSGLALEIGVVTICRLALNTARRFAYPFAPALSRGLGVSLTSITSIIAMNQATAVIGIFFGPLADRFGYRLMMFAGLGMLVTGMFSAGFLPFYGVVLAALFLAGLGKSLFDPALQAYIGERVPFERRGLIIGVLEFSWAGSTLLGIPLIALLIDRLGWRSPFFALGGVGLLGIVALKIVQSKDITKPAAHRTALDFRSAWRQLLKKRSALGAIGFAFFVSMANDNLFVIYGAWLENAFGLSIVAIGVGTSVIGIAELSGEGLTAAMSDRFGLKRSVILGLVLCMMSYGMLPLLGKALPTAFGGLFFIFLTYEFTIVTALSLCTELLPDYRATMMSSFLAAAGAGRVIGALIGGRIWLAGGILATGMVSAAMSGLGLAFLIWGLWGWSRR